MRRLPLATVVLAAATCCSTSTALAGTYDVWSCRGPDGTAVSPEAWERSAVEPGSGALVETTGVAFDDACDAGAGLSVALAQEAAIGSPVAGLLTFRPPADTRIAGYALSRRLAAGSPPPLLASYLAARTERAGATAVDTDICATADCVLGALDPEAPASLVTRPEATGDAIELRAQVDCLVALCLNVLSGVPARATLYRSRVTIEDVVAPEQPRLSGDLVEAGPSATRAALVVASEDAGGGIEAMSLEIDGEPWQTVSAGSLAASCRVPYTAPRPCPPAAEQAFEIDTGALAPGEHVASGSVVDVAGNATDWGPVPFSVTRPRGIDRVTLGPPPPDNGSPAVERPLLRVARRSLSAPAGALRRLRGRLTTRAGGPIAGARLTVATRQLGVPSARPNRDRQTTVRTDTTGRFAIPLRAIGARRITVGFQPRRGAATTARASATIRARLALRAVPARRVLVKGRSLTLRGRLRGAGPSARAALVQVKAIVNGRWSPVGRARARRDGTFAWRYRFVHLSRDTVFAFRTVVEHVPGWPWPTVRSKRVPVRVDVR